MEIEENAREVSEFLKQPAHKARKGPVQVTVDRPVAEEGSDFATSSGSDKDEDDSEFSSDTSNEFWNVDPKLQARTLLSKGRRIYKKADTDRSYQNENEEGLLGKNYSLLPGMKED